MSDVRILNDCEVLYQNKYLFDLYAPKKVGGPREVIRGMLRYFNYPLCQKRRHEIISKSRHSMGVYYFLRYLQAVFEKKLPDLEMKDPASKYRFMDACEKLFDDTVREVNAWTNPLGGHMQLYMFKHWDAFEKLGERLRWNEFFVDDVTEVFASFRNPMLSHAEVMSEMVTLTFIYVPMECCKELPDSYPKEVYYQIYLCPHEIYKFDTNACTKTGRSRVLLHAILGFEATPTLEICHRLISCVADYRDVWIFLVLVREILKQDEPFIPPRRNEIERIDFDEWCQLIDHTVTEKLRRFGIPQGAHMQLYLFTHWHEFVRVGKKLRNLCFTFEDVIKAYEKWQDSGQKTNVLMGEVEAWTEVRYSDHWYDICCTNRRQRLNKEILN
ncbi:hypothetical protein AWC38_SpisGene8230 [Stylophora pistillata]|uniref:Uncharacterized protein n=1 Tax=Stylophora pistillata TaxID=50429 RepID=A0A2B4SDB9_STYPI|nr:hypothetical protein AWC38_SpisGene8230 [Stylophora pistillata]